MCAKKEKRKLEEFIFIFMYTFALHINTMQLIGVEVIFYAKCACCPIYAELNGELVHANISELEFF